MSSSNDIAARSCSRSSTGKPLENVVDDLLREVVGDLRELVGLERLRRGDELRRVHRLDQRFADRVGDLDQDLAVALGLDQVPDVQPLVERQRLEDVGDVGRMQRVELALQQRTVLPGDERLDQLGAVRLRRMRRLLVDEPFYEPVLPQERGDFGERILDALGRLGPVGRLLVEVRADIVVACSRETRCMLRGRAHFTRRQGNSAEGIRARMMPILRFSPGAPGCARRSADSVPWPRAAPPAPAESPAAVVPKWWRDAASAPKTPLPSSMTLR